jgi:hypothetical protein
VGTTRTGRDLAPRSSVSTRRSSAIAAAMFRLRGDRRNLMPVPNSRFRIPRGNFGPPLCESRQRRMTTIESWTTGMVPLTIRRRFRDSCEKTLIADVGFWRALPCAAHVQEDGVSPGAASRRATQRRSPLNEHASTLVVIPAHACCRWQDAMLYPAPCDQTMNLDWLS